MLSNYGYLSNYIPMISFQEYLSVYNSKTHGLLLGIEVTLSNLNIVLFIAYIFLYLQKQMDETQKFAALNAELKRLNNQLKGYANLREKMGETKERNRLAREIHDTLGHTLTGLSVGLEACRVMIDKDVNVTKAQLGILEESAKRGLTDVRRSVDKLKPDALERYSLKRSIGYDDHGLSEIDRCDHSLFVSFAFGEFERGRRRNCVSCCSRRNDQFSQTWACDKNLCFDCAGR